MTELELASLLHIDEDDELSIANAVMYQKAAEEYLAGAGVAMNYSSALYRQAVIVLVTRSLDRPDMLTKFGDMPGSGIVAMIAQLRHRQNVEPAESEVAHE